MLSEARDPGHPHCEWVARAEASVLLVEPVAA
jgi:hypothetical protein